MNSFINDIFERIATEAGKLGKYNKVPLSLFYLISFVFKYMSYLFQEQTVDGAKNRAVNAYRAYREVNNVYPHLSFGLEGGLEWNHIILDQDNDKTLWCMAWMAVYGRRKSLLVDIMASRHSTCWQPDKKPIFSLSKTGSFMLPQPISKLVKEGMELGDADDKISGRVKSKHGSGTVGYLTEGMIDRSAYYEHALILALVPWIRPDMYNSKGLSTNSALTVEGSDDIKSGEQ